MIKSIFDRVFAVLFLLILSPILLFIIVLIVVVEKETPFFVQNRVGKHKRLFNVYKMRTMKNEKITKIGKVLRQTGIDELPQLFNIVKGEMSFVGPRPLTPNDIERLEWNTAYYQIRWSVLPGIVGLAQLTPVCHKKMSWFYDQLYIKKQTIGLDVKILLIASIIPLVGKKNVKKWIHGAR